MIILIGGTKGGTGKSTIAQSLAGYLTSQNQRFLLIDADQSASTKKWIERRAESINKGADIKPIVCAEKTGNQVGSFAVQSEEVYGNVIIDAGGKDSYEQRSAISVADIYIVPLSPSQKELESLEEVYDMLYRSKNPNKDVQVLFVLTRVDSSRARDEFSMAREALQHIDWATLSNNKLSFLKAYRTADMDGYSVVEMKNAGSAKAEVQLLGQQIFPNI